ncbi:MAG: sugar ABC transporter permease [Oscillospiraceae bacterium]|nr:sugar ABC transporter permease [Oscillospiraceae bacterium]
MTAKKNAQPQAVLSKRKSLAHRIARDWQLYLIVLIPLAYLLIFNYGPMYGVQIAFRDYSPRLGIIGSPWVGWKWFIKFLGSVQFKQVFMNTLILSLYSLVVGFPLPIVFALILNALRSERLKNVTQTISYMPHFISTTVMVSITLMVLSPISGIYGNLYRLFGGDGYPTDFRALASSFRHIYVWSGVWKQMGWDSIIYLAALSAVSPDLHEAAKIDGASRFKRIIHVDLPAIMPTIAILFILRCGSIIGVGFEKAYLLQSSVNLSTSEVISTFVYKNGMNSFKNFSYGSAVGLFNSIINLILLLTVNFTTKKMTDDEVALV